jgi:hypothetical protein
MAAILGVALVVGIGLAADGWSHASPQQVSQSADDDEAVDDVPPLESAEPRAEEERRVAAAVARGIAYLKERLEAESFQTVYGFYPDGDAGAASLAGLTLLECGVPPQDPAVRKAVALARAAAPAMKRTYSISLAVLLLDRFKDHSDEPMLRRLAVRLLAGQSRGRGWGYECRPLPAEQEDDLLGRLSRGEELPGERPPANLETNSNTQFALLALWAARQHGVPADRALGDAATRFRASQNANGSWGYFGGNNSLIHCDSMTCAGLLSLAVENGVKHAANRPKSGTPLHDPAILRGLEFLGQRLEQSAHLTAQERGQRLRESAELAERMQRLRDGDAGQREEVVKRIRAQLQWRGAFVGADAMGDVYFLWSVERVGVLFNVKKIGDRDWYAWGSEILLAQQKADGSWRERFPGIPDTCFALLFLKRANLIKDFTLRLAAAREQPALTNKGS